MSLNFHEKSKFYILLLFHNLSFQSILVVYLLSKRLAFSALLMNPLPDCSNYSPLCHTHYLTPDHHIVSSGQTLYQTASWRIILPSSLLQRFTAESSRELSALRKLNNKQRQVSMFLISVCSLSQSSLFSLSPSLLSLLINSLSS